MWPALCVGSRVILRLDVQTAFNLMKASERTEKMNQNENRKGNVNRITSIGTST